MSPTESIDEFCSYFERQLRVVSNLDVDWSKLPGSGPEDYQVRFYRKSLLVSGLDTLAGIRFPKTNYPELGNRDRFIRFIKEFGNWPSGQLVSVPFLNDQLIQMRPKSAHLSAHVSNQLSKFDVQAGGHISISLVDQTDHELMPLAGSEKEESAIMKHQHYSLLYRYRNYLVHEWREPGSSMEIDSLADEPYYHGYVQDPKWYLVYPMQLFTNLFNSALTGFKQYLLEKSIDPFAVVNDSTRW